jgi:hypothetical protein
MPMVTVKVIEAVFTQEQKCTLCRRSRLRPGRAELGGR